MALSDTKVRTLKSRQAVQGVGWGSMSVGLYMSDRLDPRLRRTADRKFVGGGSGRMMKRSRVLASESVTAAENLCRRMLVFARLHC